jgi:O-acetyl-ADP-ribose deacetylase (regulator of RNase III)
MGSDLKIEIIKGDITQLKVDAIIDFLNKDSSFEKAYLVCYNDDNYELTKNYFTEKF